MSNITLPTVHRNGTSRDSLLDGYIAALDALRLATEALQASAPNARDYYVQAGDTFCLAQNQHFVRLARLRDTIDELTEIAQHVSDAPDLRAKTAAGLLSAIGV
jgi:hypothetical protein